MRRRIDFVAIVTTSLLSLGAITPDQQTMLDTFDRVLTGMVYASAGLAVFSVVWAGFVLMAEGAEDRETGRARNAVVLAVSGLVLVLSAKALALVLTNGIVPIP